MNIKISRYGHNWDSGRNEHCIEVQIPFLQVVQPDVPIVPIIIGSSDFETADDLMISLLKSIKETNKKCLLVASTDLSHFHSKKQASLLDNSLITDFERYDYFKLSNDLFIQRKEACGAAPLLTVMMAAEQAWRQ
jgi:AmmeMemoRadiSam system protein B